MHAYVYCRYACLKFDCWETAPTLHNNSHWSCLVRPQALPSVFQCATPGSNIERLGMGLGTRLVFVNYS